MVGLKVTFLGTSSAAPTKGRGLPAIAVQRDGELLILDCGEGIQRQVLSLGIGLNKETTILVTHLHGDHVTGLLGLLQTMSLAQRSKPLTIVAPSRLLEWLESTYEILNVGLTFKLAFIPARPGVLIRRPEYRIRAARAEHSIEAYAFAIEETARPGVFHPERARSLGVPEGKLWSRLQRGRSVYVAGRKVAPSDVSGPMRPGRKIGYSGDTRPSRRLAALFRGSDLLIFDSTFAERDRDKAVERKHSTSVEAAELAKEAGVLRLVLTHFSARYSSVSKLLRDAKEVFPHTVAAKDGLELSVPYRDT